MTRFGVLGSGLAGTLLAWQLYQTRPDWQVELVTGTVPDAGDATFASGGLVRGYEPGAQQRRFAAASLTSLVDRLPGDWSGYRTTGSVYLCPDRPDDAALADVAELGPGPVRAVPAAELARQGWAGLPADAWAVVEELGGYYSPELLRGNVLTALGAAGVAVLRGAATELRAGPAGGASCLVDGHRHHYDQLVVAAGRWTPRLLGASGLAGLQLRTKLVQYAIFTVTGIRPPAFVDELTGLYGRPDGADRMLLGVPSDRFDIDADRPVADPDLVERSVELVAHRLPGLRLGRLVRTVGGADCYCVGDEPGLRLRPVPDAPGLYTFTAGSGGSAKTAPAASAAAANALTSMSGSALAGSGPTDPLGSGPVPGHRRKHHAATIGEHHVQ